MKRKRLLWVGGILAGLLVGVPVLLWGGFAVLALLRHEHFYHGLPSSWWLSRINRFSETQAAWGPVLRSPLAPVLEYTGVAFRPDKVSLWRDPAAADVLCDFIRDDPSGGRGLECAIRLSCPPARHPEVAVPYLISFLEERCPKARPLIPNGDRAAAAMALQRYGPEAKAAVPVLLDLLDRGDTNDQRHAFPALCAIEPENVDLPMRCLTHPAWEVRLAAARSLGDQLGAKAKAAVPALVKMYEASDPYTKRAAALALLRIDPGAAYKAGVPKGYK
jgi:hypothetical protein